MIAGPSGSGKTHLINSLKSIINDESYADQFPIIQIGTTSITQEGFKGKNVSNIYEQISQACGGKDTYAIVMLDELDKKMVPCYDSNGININATIQSDFSL